MAPTTPGWQPKRGGQAPVQRHPAGGNLTAWEQKRVDDAVALCADIATGGWETAVASRVVHCLSADTYDRLFGTRRQGDCKVLARMAKAVLAAKEKLHEFVGTGASWAAKFIRANRFERRVVKELAQRIHIPVVDEKAIVVARGLQIIGILLCLNRDIPLNRCQSFIDLSLAETKERVKEILVAAMTDWTRPSDGMLVAWGARTAAHP